MSTTSLKIPNEIKQLAVVAALQQGVSPHAFMVDAIRVMATAAEKRAQLVADALASREATLKSGTGFAAAEVSAYLIERSQGKNPARPKAVSWRA
jgi:hypothetical protein